MANILINGISSKSGGGRSIFNNYLSLLKTYNSNDVYYILTPNRNEYSNISNNFIKLIKY